ncbi:carboxylesterase 1-like [Dorcoceras hygrometricum]|uniref:Carboxylesterase 1-like n=1 Tax=Dorcoceras hygrometricum TaxID=472368 RepID=A0A2Z7DFK0_9LAMI|nr:carboxylesterase 1-like [Dorcoceras hygrometricum]
MAGSQNLKADQERIQLIKSGHGVREYMGATHSSQHTAPDAEHSSTRCCPTHEMWELPTPLIVANRSQQGDEVYGSYPLVLTGILVRTDQYNKAQKARKQQT